MAKSLDKLVLPIVVSLLIIQSGLLAFSAMRYSPTMDEPGHLAAGLSHWKFGRFELYRVNPPLVRMVAALPVVVHGYEEDWSDFQESPGQRPVFAIGRKLVENNGPDSIWLFTIARWACIPFCLMGGLICFFWSRQLWGNNIAGLISLTLWTFDPGILGNGALITPDCGAAAMGLLAVYFFWRWLRKPGWQTMFIAGTAFGIALLTKTTWIVLFGLYAILWCYWRFSVARQNRLLSRQGSPHNRNASASVVQLGSIFLLAVFVLNMGYVFDGAFPKLGDQAFVSEALTGDTDRNRFENTWMGELRLPVPKQYLLGIDVQKRDLESSAKPSYLKGEWRNGGWWYYYLYAFLVKWPHGTQALLVFAVMTLAFCFWRKRSGGVSDHRSEWTHRDLLVLLVPPITVLVLVSSQMAFNHHFRYVLPVTGFAFVFAGVASVWFTNETASVKARTRADVMSGSE